MKIAIIAIVVLQIISVASASSLKSSENFGSLTMRRLAIEKLQGFDRITKTHMRRRLQSNQSGNWRRMKIHFDLTTLNKENPSKADFYKKVFWLTGQWWEQAVWINDSVEGKDNVFEQGISQGLIRKFAYPEGKSYKDYDLVVDVHMQKNDGGTLAAAGPLYRHEDTQRPITGDCSITWFGDDNFAQSEDSVNKAVGTIVHEFAHVMAFISMDEYHKHYVHYDQGMKSFKWTGPRVRAAASKYYGCKGNEMTGLALQTTNPKEVGAHWSEDLLNDELLTPVSGAEPEKVSPMTLAFLEDTKWYKSDYRMVENYDHKKDKPGHCAMKKNKSCDQRTACTKGSSDFVTWDFRGMAYCQKDANDGCYKEVKYGNRDIAQPAKWPKWIKNYGASFDANSIIVKGNFLRFVDEFSGITRASVVPVMADCDNDHSSYQLTFKDYGIDPSTPGYSGDATVICSKEGEIQKFNCYEGYCSEVVCYDPKVLCPRRFSAIGNYGKDFKSCHKSCLKNGRCMPGLPIAVAAEDEGRRLKREMAETNEIIRAFPRQNRRLTIETFQRWKFRAMSSEQLQDWILKHEVDCKGMSKDRNCGAKAGFCRKGWCHSKKNKCGVFANYYRNQNPKYSSKVGCRSLHFAKKVEKLRDAWNHKLEGWDVDTVGTAPFKSMMADFEDHELDKEQFSAFGMDLDDDDKPKLMKKNMKHANFKNSTKHKEMHNNEDKQKHEKVSKLKKVGLTTAKKVHAKKVTAKKTQKVKTNIAPKYLKPAHKIQSDDLGKMPAQDLKRLAKNSQKGTWKCWCYSDAKMHGTCGDLPEDAKA